jgi:hypothetical protein
MFRCGLGFSFLIKSRRYTMEINKILSAGFVAAAVLLNAGSAAIDPDINAKTGLGLKQYCQHFKNLAAGHAPLAHHAALGGTDTDELLQDVGVAHCPTYVVAELARAKARGLAAINALGAPADALVDAVGGAGADGVAAPANATVAGFAANFSAAFDAGLATRPVALPAGVVSPSHRHIGDAIEAVDAAFQAAIAPWLANTGAATTDGGRNAAIQAILHAADGAGGGDNSIARIIAYIQAAVINHP